MPDLTASIPHQLSRDEAKRRIREHVSQLRRQQGGLITDLRESWNGDDMDFSLMAMGQSISGHLTIDDQRLHLTVALPWFLRFVAGTIQQRLVQEGRHLLAPTK